MNKKVIEIVRKYVEEHLDKSDPKQEYDVYVGATFLVMQSGCSQQHYLMVCTTRRHTIRLRMSST